MPGLREVVSLIPPVLIAQLSITSPTQALGTARIIGSNDATYGTVGWTPPLNGTPFAVLELMRTKEVEQEVGRIRAKGIVNTFIAIEHTDTPTVMEDYHDRQMAWMDSMRQVVAANRRLYPGTITQYPTAGDVRWQMTDINMISSKPFLGSIWRGIECLTNLEASIVVNFQG